MAQENYEWVFLVYVYESFIDYNFGYFSGMVQKMTQQEDMIKEMEEKMTMLQQESEKVHVWFF